MGDGLGLGRDSAVRVLDGDVSDSHVGCEELGERVDTVTRQSVERVAHAAAVRVLVVSQATVAGSIALTRLARPGVGPVHLRKSHNLV